MSQRSRFSRAKILVLGGSGVGKTAFAVRYITKRFIGEYDPNKEMLYTHKHMVDKDLEVTLELLDTAHDTDGTTMESHIRWADGFILMYSVADKSSFTRADFFYSLIHHQRRDDDNTPIVFVANKTDLLHVRRVSEVEGEDLGSKFECPLYEISIAESPIGVSVVMDDILKQIKREYVKKAAGLEKKSAFTNVKRVLKKKIYRSRSDTQAM